MPFQSEKLRADFPILDKRLSRDRPLVYFDNAASTQRPRQVIDAIVDTYESHYANVHRGIHQLAQDADERYEASREKVRRFIAANSTEEIIFTSGTTASINLVARSWGDAHLRAGDEILLTEMEHHSNLVPWQQLAQRTGAALKHIPLTDEGLLDLDALPDLLGKKTKIVAFATVSNVLGTLSPAKEIIRRAHEVGAVVLLDGAQSVPHCKTDVAELDCDFLAFSGHKMLGPSGVGVLYGKRELLETMPPFLGGGSMIKEVYLDRFTPADLPNRFEAGTPPIVPAIALGAAIDYLEMVGMEAISEHEHHLTHYAHEILDRVNGLRILGPDPAQKAGIVSFTMDRIHPHDIAELLDRQGIAIRAGHHCAMPLHLRYGLSATARASFYFYNTREEVEKLGEALEEIKQFFRPRKRTLLSNKK
jgi:cysteine desulfurase/selenocysteine lyase